MFTSMETDSLYNRHDNLLPFCHIIKITIAIKCMHLHILTHYQDKN